MNTDQSGVVIRRPEGLQLFDGINIYQSEEGSHLFAEILGVLA